MLIVLLPLIFMLFLGIKKEGAPKPLASSTLLFDKSSNPSLPLPTLHYATIDFSSIYNYTPTPNGLIPTTTAYTPYGEGFIPTSLRDTLFAPIQAHSPKRSPHFYQYMLFEDWAVVAYSGDLDGVYIVDLQTHTAHQLHYLPSQDLGAMYVYGLQVVDRTLVLLGGEAHSYNALIYTIDLDTRTVTSANRLVATKDARYKEDFSITPSGMCVLISPEGVLSYNPFAATAQTYKLPFMPTRLLSGDATTFALAQEDTSLYLTDLTTQETTTLTLPAPHLKIVDQQVKDTQVYSLLYDPYGALYTHYLTVHDLTTGQWMYCLGLISHTNDFSFVGLSLS